MARRTIWELPSDSTPIIRMALLEAIDSIATSLNSLEIKSPVGLKSLGTSGRAKYFTTVKEYKRRLASYRKLLKQLGGKIHGDRDSYEALREATE